MAIRDDILALDAVIFDLDGTLINTPEAYYRVVQAAFARLGLPPVPRKTLYHAASDSDFNWDEVLPDERSVSKEDLIIKIRAVIREIIPQFFPKEVRMIDGAADTLKEIAGAGPKIGIVTSTPIKLLEKKWFPLRESGIDRLVDAIITPDDVSARKPDPEPLVVCVKALDASLERSVYVGDTCGDMRAGKAAGMKTVGVLTGFATCDALKKEGPDLILESVAGLRSC